VCRFWYMMLFMITIYLIRDLTLDFPVLPQNKMAFIVCLSSVLKFKILFVNI
jgi:hypothetical protein